MSENAPTSSAWQRLQATTASRQIVLLVALQALLVLLVVLVSWPSTNRWHTNDLLTYFRAARGLLDGQLPYRDFALEYPPLALLPFALPQLAGQPFDASGYVWRFLVQSVLFSSLVAVTLARVLADWRPTRRNLALGVYALLVALLAPLLPWRYDLFPALLTLLALLCAQRGLPGLAGWWLGCGVAAKLYPLVLLPIFAAYYLVDGDWRALLRLGLGSALAVLGALLPFALLAPDDLFTFLSYHQQRGLQVESLPAGAIMLARGLGWTEAEMVYNYGALHLVSPLAETALGWLPFALVGLFALVLARSTACFRSEQRATGAIDTGTLANSCVAALLVFIITNKVLSPQYLIWLLPFAPLLGLRQAGLLAVICAVTTLLFPFEYENLLAMQFFPVLLLNLRNGLLVALLLWLLLGRREGKRMGG